MLQNEIECEIEVEGGRVSGSDSESGCGSGRGRGSRKWDSQLIDFSPIWLFGGLMIAYNNT